MTISQTERGLLGRIFTRLRMAPSAADLWIITATILYAFDRPIPWWLWFILAMELMFAFALAFMEHVRG